MKSTMSDTCKTFHGNLRGNILHNAIHPELGFVWTDGECVYLSSTADASIPSLHNTKTLGKFSEVAGCSWSQCGSSSSSSSLGIHYLAVQHKTCVVLWQVETSKSRSNPDFKKLYTVEHSDHGKGCEWHPSKPVLLVYTKSQAILYSIPSSEMKLLDDGMDLTAACWTLDEQYIILADGNHLKTFKMDLECKKCIGTHSTSIQGKLGSVCCMRPLSNHIIAIATELPLQNIVTKLSADLFSAEMPGNECNGHDLQSVLHENETDFCSKDDPNGNIYLTSKLKIPVPGCAQTMHSKGNGKNFPAVANEGSKMESCSASSSAFNEQVNISSVRSSESCPTGFTLVEEALKKKTGPIDMMDILSQMKERLTKDATDAAEDEMSEHNNDGGTSIYSTNSDKTNNSPNPMDGVNKAVSGKSVVNGNSTTLHSTNGDKTSNYARHFYALNMEVNGSEVRTCSYRAETSDERPHYHLTKNLKSVTDGGPGDALRALTSVGENLVALNRDRREGKFEASSNDTKLVDLTSLKTQDGNGAPRFQHAREPGAGSCASIGLFDVRSRTFLSKTDLPGIITPSLIHYQPSRKVLVVGSNSRRTLSLYAVTESSLKRLPQSIDLGESEHPVGICSLPNRECGILVAFTKPVSDEGSFRGVLPSSAKTPRLLSLKAVDLTMGQAPSNRRGVPYNTQPNQPPIPTSSPENDDDGLQTMRLPGGLALKANVSSVGNRLGRESEYEVSFRDVRAVTGHLAGGEAQESFHSRYPSPDNAAYVTLKLIKNRRVFQKCFLLRNGHLPLATIQDVFHLTHIELQVGSNWIVLTSDYEGIIPLSFQSGSIYNIREAAITNSPI